MIAHLSAEEKRELSLLLRRLRELLGGRAMSGRQGARRAAPAAGG